MEAATGLELLAAKDAWQAQLLHVNQDDMAAMRERVRDRDRDRGRHTARLRESDTKEQRDKKNVPVAANYVWRAEMLDVDQDGMAEI